MLVNLITLDTLIFNHNTFVELYANETCVQTRNMITKEVYQTYENNDEKFFINCIDDGWLLAIDYVMPRKVIFISATECLEMEFDDHAFTALTNRENFSQIGMTSHITIRDVHTRLIRIGNKIVNTMADFPLSEYIGTNYRTYIFNDQYMIKYRFNNMHLAEIGVIDLYVNKITWYPITSTTDYIHKVDDISSFFFYNPITKILVIYAWASKRLHIAELDGTMLNNITTFNPNINLNQFRGQNGNVSFSSDSKDFIFVVNNKITLYKFSENTRTYRKTQEVFVNKDIEKIYPNIYTDKIFIEDQEYMQINVFKIT